MSQQTPRFVAGSAMFSTTDREGSGGSAVVASMEWGTPQELFDGLNARWGPFTLDAAASHANHKCDRYFTEADDSLTQAWGDGDAKVWINPPFSGNVGVWFEKAAQEIAAGNVAEVTVLVPARTDTQWFHRSVLPHASSIHFLEGRLRYERYADDGSSQGGTPAPFPSMVVRLTGQTGGKIELVAMRRDGTSDDDERVWL
jgi:phage N-6-adenine-methyltransferase